MQTQQQPPAQQNTFTFGNQPQSILDMDIELHQKLVKAGIIKASPKGKINEQGKKISIDNETSLIIESGVALAKYLSASKAALMVTQSLNFIFIEKGPLRINDRCGQTSDPEAFAGSTDETLQLEHHHS